MAYQRQLRRFVHEECANQNFQLPDYIPATTHAPPQDAACLTDLLAPGSPFDDLPHEYRQEVVRWIQFHAEYREIPGIHVDFTNDSIEKYLSYRARSTKCLDHILCKLKKMGKICNHILHTSKYQQPSLQYMVIQDVKRKLRKQRREAGLDADKNEALATGHFAISMLLQGFNITCEQDFVDLHPSHREFTTLHVLQHAGCLRFGVFNNTDPERKDVKYSAVDGDYLFSSTWRKTRKSNRPFTVRIKTTPTENYPASYRVKMLDGTATITAGQLLHWYLRSTGLINAPPSTLLFPISAMAQDRRRIYGIWLQYVYSCVLPENSPIPQRIRPHSPRAGWATDRANQNIPLTTLKLEGRWEDERSMMTYVRENLRQLCTSDDARPIPHTDPSNPLPCFPTHSV